MFSEWAKYGGSSNNKILFKIEKNKRLKPSEISILGNFFFLALRCGGHDEQHLHGGQHQGHPNDQVCVTLQDGGVLRGVVDMMNNISTEVHIEDILMTKFVSLCRMEELSICDSFLDPRDSFLDSQLSSRKESQLWWT